MNKKTYVNNFQRQQDIHDKGFNMIDKGVVNYARVKIGNGKNKSVDDVSVNLSSTFNSMNTTYTDKSTIL